MYTKFIDKNILNPYLNLLRDPRQRYLLNKNQHKFPLSMIISLNNRRKSCKLNQEKSEFSRTCKMKKAIKGLLRKKDFFFHNLSIMKQRRNLRKICGQLINSFCSISPKIIRGEKQNTRKCSPLTLCLHKRQVMLDAIKFCSCFTFFFYNFLERGGGGGNIYLGPYYTKSQEFQI